MKKAKLKIGKKMKKIFVPQTSGLLSKSDHKKITHLQYNRGKIDSIDPERVKYIKEQLLKGNWDDVCTIIINVYGIIVDGNHTYDAYTDPDIQLEVPYYVTGDLQTTDVKTLVKAVSKINAHNSKWGKGETFNTAKWCGFPLALRVEELVNEISKNTNIATTKIKHSWIFSLIHKDSKLFSNSKMLDYVETYDDDNAFAFTNTPEFQEEVDIYCFLVNKIKHIGSRYNNALSEILKLHWNNTKFDINVMMDKINLHGFNPKSYGKRDTQQEIQRIYNFNLKTKYFHIYRGVRPNCSTLNVVKMFDFNK